MKYLEHMWTLVTYHDGSIFAAAENRDIVELDISLNVIKEFKIGPDRRNYRPRAIDANEKFIVVGWHFFVDVYSRKEPFPNGSHRRVSNFL